MRAYNSLLGTDESVHTVPVPDSVGPESPMTTGFFNNTARELGMCKQFVVQPPGCHSSEVKLCHSQRNSPPEEKQTCGLFSITFVMLTVVTAGRASCPVACGMRFMCVFTKSLRHTAPNQQFLPPGSQAPGDTHYPQTIHTHTTTSTDHI